jgi:glycosyltransferase involved in cell wall biosynthesis
VIILSHPIGNQNVKAAALGLNDAGLLLTFMTSIASFPGSLLDRLGAIGPLSEIRRRRFDSSLRPVTQTFPLLEVSRLIALKAGFTRLTKHEDGAFSIDKVLKNFDRHVANCLRNSKKQGGSAVYAYEDAAQFSFRAAKERDMTCLYDLPIGYWRTARRLLDKERVVRPEWASTLIGFKDSEAKLRGKDEELRLADHIFVASQFTANTLKDFPGTLPPIKVISYGFPPVARTRSYLPSSNRPLKLLFVGGLSQRKGIAYIFEAVAALGRHVELTIVGRKTNNDCQVLDNALVKNTWIPSLPHADILKLMQVNDVLLFPSLFEGFGLVITEAMSQGTPVITTDRTAGPDFINHGKNGWLIEAGSAEQLQIAIEKLLNRPQEIAEAGKNAMETARSRPWEVYGHELANAVKEAIPI